MLAFIPFITTLLFLSTAGAASTKDHKKPDPAVQSCGRSWGEFANLGKGLLGCLNYGSAHYSCPADECGVGQAPAVGQKSTAAPTFKNCQKYKGNFGDDTNLDGTKITVLAVSYFFNYKDGWLRVYGYDSKAPRSAGDLPGYKCEMPKHAPAVIAVCRNCTYIGDAKW
ncbi:uncharacterized protein MELLADRAFT_92881 [Melampsora larici-populina 98AG31]|uniref:Secreted protein n=1 Tax=Melampsora larici-populina (strain 98AG31 / pathotype 3-4-7) TaxID=747676 RepID=F4S342_MELLP|nr:uncharacterized protein MELLADRAFT_92881 [Melampsora larici-populina 98AG31]EGG00916.1 secreted protein [Melampsora larici-populina 98AG31]